jgi:hypothetical protein
MIEAWTTEAVTATCAGMSSAGGNFFSSRVQPYLDTTVKGWVWYVSAFPACTYLSKHLSLRFAKPAS